MNDSMQTPAQLDQKSLTPLAEFLLASTGVVHGPGHQDSLSGDESGQLSTLLHGAGALDLASMSRIDVAGADRVRWLNGMMTNNIQAIEEGSGNYNFILNVQGRIQGDAYVYRHGERLLLHTSQIQTQKLLQHLDHFIIMDDVELESRPDLTVLGLTGPLSHDVLEKAGVSAFSLHLLTQPLKLSEVEIAGVKVILIRSYGVLVPHYELWFDRHQVGVLWQALLEGGAVACGSPAAETMRIIEGIPAYGVDLHDRDLPQETGQARALNFSKGCYLGQEIVERIRSRGNVHRAFRQMELTGDAPINPAELRMNGKAVGQITSTASVKTSASTRLLALGFLRSEVLTSAPGTNIIEYNGGTAIPLEQIPDAAAFAGLKSQADTAL